MGYIYNCNILYNTSFECFISKFFKFFPRVHFVPCKILILFLRVEIRFLKFSKKKTKKHEKKIIDFPEIFLTTQKNAKMKKKTYHKEKTRIIQRCLTLLIIYHCTTKNGAFFKVYQKEFPLVGETPESRYFDESWGDCEK